MYEVECPFCGRRGRIDPSKLPSEVRCPDCKTKWQVAAPVQPAPGANPPAKPVGPIAYVCPHCSTPLEADVAHAGQVAICGACQKQTVVPDRPVSTGSVPLDIDLSPSQSPRNAARKSSPMNGVMGPIGIGLLVGVLVILVMAALTGNLPQFNNDAQDNRAVADQGQANARQANAQGGLNGNPPGNRPQANELVDVEITVTEALAKLAVLILSMLVPLSVPAILARRGYLSIGRWVCAAAFCAFAILTWIWLTIQLAMMQLIPSIKDGWSSVLLTSGFSFWFFGIGGCLLAAALYSKKQTP